MKEVTLVVHCGRNLENKTIELTNIQIHWKVGAEKLFREFLCVVVSIHNLILRWFLLQMNRQIRRYLLSPWSWIEYFNYWIEYYTFSISDSRLVSGIFVKCDFSDDKISAITDSHSSKSSITRILTSVGKEKYFNGASRCNRY